MTNGIITTPGTLTDEYLIEYGRRQEALEGMKRIARAVESGIACTHREIHRLNEQALECEEDLTRRLANIRREEAALALLPGLMAPVPGPPNASPPAEPPRPTTPPPKPQEESAMHIADIRGLLDELVDTIAYEKQLARQDGQADGWEECDKLQGRRDV